MKLDTRIRTVIVDDEPLARTNLRTLLMRDQEIEITGECGSGTEAIEMIRSTRPELLLLDVQMPGCDGFEVLERLGCAAPPAVIFVTAYDRFALKAFEAEALDYLLKPFDDARFAKALARAKETARSRKRTGGGMDRVMVKSAGRISFLRADEIDWVEAADYYACLHVAGKTHLLRRSMAELEKELDALLFCRIHRSAIVNLERMRELRLDLHGEYEVVLRDGTALRLSRSHRDQLQARLRKLGVVE
jgi:two-component system LytT family response regulator